MIRRRTGVVTALGGTAVAVHLIAIGVGGLAGYRLLGVAGVAAVIAALVIAHVGGYRRLLSRRGEGGGHDPGTDARGPADSPDLPSE